jgi:hypothetical protein
MIAMELILPHFNKSICIANNHHNQIKSSIAAILVKFTVKQTQIVFRSKSKLPANYINLQVISIKIIS